MSLKNKVVLVTGASRGIGQAIALAFGKAGCKVVLNASKSPEALAQTKTILESYNVSVLTVLADVGNYESCQKMFAEIEATFGTVDILVNNAGISYMGLFSDMTPAQWQRVMDVNLGSVFHCTHLAVLPMVQKKEGVILNISSIWGASGASCEAVYSASKGGMNAFTQAMAKELAPSGIRVNAIACGVIETQMNNCLDPSEKADLCQEIPLQRFGSVEDVAKLALFIADADKSAYLTGQIITLDGGMLS